MHFTKARKSSLLSAAVVTAVCLNSITAQHLNLSHWSTFSVCAFHWYWGALQKIEHLFFKADDCCYSSPAVKHTGYLCLAARPLLYWGASAARTPGFHHLPAWHKMSGWRWQRTNSQSEKMRCSFKDLPEALGLHTGKRDAWSVLFRKIKIVKHTNCSES